jgi:superfamily II DNA helicase RecQ
VVYLSPEKVDSDEVKKNMWFSANFRHLIQLIAVDEAHLVDEWYLYRVLLIYTVTNFFRGKESRTSYGRVGDIRGVFRKRPPWFITSATLPNNQLVNVLESLRIDDPIQIDEPLDRPNLYYNVINSHIGDRFRGGTTPLDHVVEFVPDGNGLPKLKKTLIYFDSIATLGAFLYHLRNLLVLSGVSMNLARQLIQGYFATRSPEAKEKVLREFQAGIALIILATEAFGMGMDVPDIE